MSFARQFFLKFKKIFFEPSFLNLLIVIFFLSGLFLILNYFHTREIVANQPVFGGIYREGLYEHIDSLNPIFPLNESERSILNIIYPPLIEFNNGSPISRFLKDYSFSADQLTFRLELKDKLFWSNGEELTTDDLLFSLDVYRKYNSAETLFLKTVDFKIVDSKQAEFHLKNVDNYFLYKLAAIRIFPRKTFANIDFENFSPDLLKVGNGPFVLEKINKLKDIQEIYLTRNNYYQPKPYLEKVIFYSYPSTKRAFDGLLLKEIDGLAGLTYLELPQNLFLDFKINRIVLPRIVGIFFNSQKIDKKIIDYLNQHLNRQELIKRVFKNQAEASETIFSPTIRKIFGFKDVSLLDKNSQSNEKQPDFKNLNLEVLSSYLYPDIGRYLKEKFGFSLNFIDKVELEAKLASKEYSALLMGVNYSWPPLLAYFWTQTGVNLNNLSDPTLETKIQQLASSPQPDFLQALVSVEESIISTKANVFLLNPYYLFIQNKKIKNFDQTLLFNPESRFVKIEYWYKK